MRNGRYGVILGGFVGTAALLAGGCDTTWEEFYKPLTDPKLATWNDGGTGGSDGGRGTGGTGGGIPAGCIPSENVDAVADTCGVFVSSSLGDDGNVGSKSAPLKTIAAAIAVAKGKPVYACGELFDQETVAIAEDATLYGALDCANGWAYDASKKTRLAPTVDAIPRSISNATTNAELYDFAITSADAMQDGGSSIAVLVAQASVSFTRCDVTAGSGKAGAAGAALAKVTTPASAKGTDGGDDPMCDNASVIAGGPGGTNTCDGMTTNGGNGGKGVPASTGDNGGGGLRRARPGGDREKEEGPRQGQADQRSRQLIDCRSEDPRGHREAEERDPEHGAGAVKPEDDGADVERRLRAPTHGARSTRTHASPRASHANGAGRGTAWAVHSSSSVRSASTQRSAWPVPAQYT